jgi:hypothetical protein
MGKKGPRGAPTPNWNGVLKRQLELFRMKFGRDPGGDDPLFFDPDAPGPDPVPIADDQINREMRKAFAATSFPPQFVYAWEKTGILVGEKGYRRMRPEDRAQYDAAIREYFRLEREAGKRSAS